MVVAVVLLCFDTKTRSIFNKSVYIVWLFAQKEAFNLIAACVVIQNIDALQKSERQYEKLN